MNAPRLFRALGLGFALALGASALAPSEALADTTHVVHRGQTLFWIAKRYRTSPEAIREANGLREGQLIHPGLELTIPGKDDGEKTKSSKKKSKEAKKNDKKSKEAKKSDETDEKPEKSPKKGKHRKKDKDDKKAKDDAKKGDKSYAARPKKPGYVTMMRGTETLTTRLLTRGKLNPAALPGLTKILRHVASDSKKSVDPRLAYLIGLVSDHFGGRKIRVVSGYRPFNKKQYTPHSNHNFGRAMDFSIDGVPNTVVRDYCRTLRDAGVGYYPNSTFVHLDVRTGKAYWIDYSGPGEAPRYNKGAKGKVDESRSDVEPSAEPGSEKTQNSGSKATEITKENQDSSKKSAPVADRPGPKTPTPPKADSPTPAEGKSSDPAP